VKRRVDKAISAATLAVFIFFGTMATAQDRAFLQIEAHAAQATAARFAEDYAAMFDNVVGYRLPQTGWHVIALGPYSSNEVANSVRLRLQSERLIPSDAFVTDGARYGAQYWPDPALRADGAAPGAELPPRDVPTETVAEDAPAPVAVAEPAPEPIPDETLAEARRNEARLTTEERAAIQTALQWKGFYTLAIDASFGPGTRNSMAEWQAAQGYDATGVLTTRQRAELIGSYESEIAAFGFQTYRDEEAGIEITLPMGMVAFDRYEAPFVHLTERDGSGVQVLLISQAGSLATLFGLYEIMQTLEIVPLDGLRERRRSSFLLTGRNDTLRSHTYAEYANGQVKGYTLIWTPENDARIERALPEMEASFAMFGPALPDSVGQPPSSVARDDLLAGLEIRRPLKSRTGFFIDPTGRVLTTASLADECGRLTIDQRYEMRIALRDDALGIIVLEPGEPLAPLAFANFQTEEPSLASEVILAGFSYEDLLSRPILTFGQLGALEGLDGNATLRRLVMQAMPGDIGGPVFDRTGTVLGMLMPPQVMEGRQLPDDVAFAVSAPAIEAVLRSNGVRPASVPRSADMAGEELTLMAADITVLVSCWD